VLVLAPFSLILVRSIPEDLRLQVDGAPDQPSELGDLTIWQALSSPAFWIFGLSSSLFGLVYSGIALFNQSILEQLDFDATVYHSVLVISTLFGLVANFGGGWLA